MIDRRPHVTMVPRAEAGRDIAPSSMTFGALIRRYRLTAGLTQEELAERAAVSTRSVSDLERGLTHRPQRETVRLLADALQLPEGDRAVFEAVARGRSIAPPHLVPSADPPHNLPTPLTPLIGRDTEIRSLCTLLRRDDVRLVTVTGTGGIGKTRLALDAVRNLLGDFPDGVFFVSLATVRDPGFLLAAIAQTLGVKIASGQRVRESLTNALARKRLLLVLDNVEQIASAAVAVAELLVACGNVKALVTSRTALSVRGEHEQPMQPLPLPTTDEYATLSLLAGVASVTLFVQRARAVRPDFRLTDANCYAVASICTRLDGLPLAIELAAAQIKATTPAQLLARLERRLPLLVGGARDLPERQRTMRDTIAWSDNLLDPDAQRLFRALAVFVGGWTHDAAAAIATAMGMAGALESLTSLVDASLVQAHVRDETTRYTMLETIREYSDECLTAPDRHVARRAHADYFLALAEAAAPHLSGSGQVPWLDQLETEHDNLRAALGGLRDEGMGEAGLRLATALAQFWLVRGHLSEGGAWLGRFFALTADDLGCAMTATRAEALGRAGMLAMRQGDYPRAIACYEEGLAVWRVLGDSGGVALLLRNLGVVAWYQGDHDRAAEHFTASLAHYRERDDAAGIAAACNNLGLVADRRGSYDEAVERYTTSLTLWRTLGDKQGIANALHNLGLVAQKRLETENAATFYTESLAVRREIGDRPGIAQSLNGLGIIASLRGEYARAESLFQECLALDRELGNRASAAHALYHWAVALQRSGAYDRAQICYEESLAIREEIGSQVEIADSLTGLAHIARLTRDEDRAAGLYEAALPRYQSTGNALGAVGCLEGIALLADQIGQEEYAVTLLAAMRRQRDALGTPSVPAARAGIDRMLAAARAALGEATFTAAWQAGVAMSLEETCEAVIKDHLSPHRAR